MAKEEVKYLLCYNENSHLQHCLPIELLLYEVTKFMDAKVFRLYICTFIPLPSGACILKTPGQKVCVCPISLKEPTGFQ